MSQNPHYKNFKWTFSTLGCHDLSLEECSELAKKFGLKFIEARAFEDRIDLPELFAEKYGAPENIRKKLDELGVEISCFDTSLKLIGNNDESREEFLKFIPWAEAAGTSLLRIFDGGTPETKLEGEALEQALDTLNWWHELRDTNGWTVDIAIETHDCLTTVSEYKKLKSATDRNLRIIWDTHHTWKKANVPVSDSWEALQEDIESIHIKDSITKPSARHPFTYVQLGDGEFPLNETLDIISKNGYDKFVCVEWERKWHPYLLPLSEALSQAQKLEWF